ncbi:MAG TPA: helix-turn-helix domain-containing protein [Thermoanaerobaculia bacterium]
MTNDLVFTTEAAAHCHLSPRTLEKRRVVGGGPAFYKVGRRVLYSLRELDEWIAQGRRISTADPGHAGRVGDPDRS